MILVDIYVPTFDRVYDFSLNEMIPVKDIIEEVVEVIGQKEQCMMSEGTVQELKLWSMDLCSMLSVQESLFAIGIKQGSKLLLV